MRFTREKNLAACFTIQTLMSPRNLCAAGLEASNLQQIMRMPASGSDYQTRLLAVIHQALTQFAAGGGVERRRKGFINPVSQTGSFNLGSASRERQLLNI